MTIKSENVNKHYIFFIIAEIIVFVFGILWAGFEGKELVGIIVCYFLVLYYIVSAWFCNGKMIIMDEKGCEVRVWRFCKKYSWNEFKTKRLELYKKYEAQKRGIIFSKREIDSMNYSHPELLAFIRPYMDYFYVTFPLAEEDTTWLTEITKEPDWYEVNEDEFISKMHEWGVRIENGLPPEKRQKYPDDWI